MKNLKVILTTIIFISVFANCEAQILEKIANKTKKKIENEVEKRTERRINKGVDKAFDKIEAKIDSVAKGDDKSVKKDPTESVAGNRNPVNKTETNEEQQGKQLVWSKFDFIPGTDIIFEDNQVGEQNGEVPGKWDLVAGSIENANFDGSNVIMFRKCNTNGEGGIVPLIQNSSEDYLPDEFTIEFDAFFENDGNIYRIHLIDNKNQKKFKQPGPRKYIRFEQNSADGESIDRGYYPGFTSSSHIKNPGWRHISLSFNKRALKAYIDDARVLNIPNIDYNPTGFCIAFHNPSGAVLGYIKNIRIAKGAVPLYDKILTDGKFVTTGIKFDVNRATIKPESSGTINYVFKMMQDNPELRFSVEGHTDSDGSDETNLTLSQKRAESVANELIRLGIASDRLSSKGLGESKPLSENNTPEGKAQNRRVEFVKK